jgi:REP element-mobilizing transposase RayT
MDKFKNKYRIASARAPFHDYASDGAYFITICTKNRIPWFGTVKNGKMELSEAGRLAWECWLEIPQHFPFVSLGAFVAMPDHVHGIVIIDKNETGPETRHVETQNFASLRDTDAPKNRFGPQSKNLASVVRGFKTGVTKKSRLHFTEFAWQTRYYDRIIRNKTAFHAVTRYIEMNVENYPGLG